MKARCWQAAAKYDTDGADRRYFITEIIIHAEFTAQVRAQDTAQVRAQVKAQVKDIVIDRITETLLFCITPKTRAEILDNIGLTDRYNNLKDNINPAIEHGLLEKTIPEKPTSGQQKYLTTKKGKEIINQLIDCN